MLNKKLEMLPLKNVKINDPFWNHYMDLVLNQSIPYQWEVLNDRVEDIEPSHCLQNFKIAAGMQEGKFEGMVFQDSDIYKWIEAAAYTLEWHPDKELERKVDEAVDIISAAQQPDGYLDTYYIINGLDKRFTCLMDNHELYCLGHMIEGAVAYYNATGKSKFLDTAIRCVNCVSENIGPEEGKKHGYPGHEIIEMALIRLYKITGDKKHLALAKYFIDQRGQEPLYFLQEMKSNGNSFYWKKSNFQLMYYQAGMPVREQKDAVGHAVRAVYLYSGMADVASETEDKELFDACERLWESIVYRNLYITGGIGSSEYGEAFTFDYDLPNDTVYAETCASIGLIFFCRRMFEITKESRYIDICEQAFYNGTISGVSLDGKRFFYVNPLEVDPEACEKDYHKREVKPTRQKWFACACCPPNLARLLASIGGYAYEENESELYINLYISGDVNTSLGGTDETFHVETRYPWNGDVRIRIKQPQKAAYSIALRIPNWCESYSIRINGEITDCDPEKGYLMLTREFEDGDTIELSMDMPIRLVNANPFVREDVGKVAITKGPVVYCLEQEDNGAQLQELLIDPDSKFVEAFEPDLLDGVMTVSADGYRIAEKEWKKSDLYKSYQKPALIPQKLKFIPYYAWANRSIGEMSVWVRHI